MTLTYVGTLATDLDLIRFHIGDTVTSAGPKPADGNFTDAELTGLVTLEGTWQRATAAAFESLASLWAKHANFSADGVSVSLSRIAEAFDAKAKQWRRDYGGSGTTGTVAVTRIDGYSDDVDNVTLDS